jgi:hypothetical protein
MYYWDGARWVSTLSPDGRHRWNGQAWTPVPGGPYYVQPAATRVPTAWTRPLQYAVAGWYCLRGLYAITLPFWLKGYLDAVVNQSLQRYPQSTYPPGFADYLSNAATLGYVIGAFIGVGLAAVAVLGALRRWTWVFYAVLLLLGLGAIVAPLNLLFTFGVLPTGSVISPPAWTYWESAVAGLVDACICVAMLVALIRHGPWGMRRVS